MSTQRQRNKYNSAEETGINDLPETILHHILSFLPLDDAIRTSTVSRPWRNLWRSVSTLHFDMIDYHSKIPHKSFFDARQLFSKFISNSLFIHRPEHLNLHTFRLRFCSGNTHYTRSHIGPWLRAAVAARSVELDLHFSTHPHNRQMSKTELGKYADDEFILCSSLFSDVLVKSSVEVLKLNGVVLKFSDEALLLRLESIREVHLDNFRSTDEEIGGFIASCVNLKRLSLFRGFGLKDVNIVSQKLEHLKLREFNLNKDVEFSVEICGPSLTSLDLFNVNANKLALKRSSALVEAQVYVHTNSSSDDFKYWTNVLSCLSGVERLTIQNMWPSAFPNQYPPGDKVFSETTPVFHNLKHVKLLTEFSKNDIRGLENLLRHCPELETMVLVYKAGFYLISDKWCKDMMNIVFQVPRLRLVEMKAFRASDSEMRVVELLKKHGVVLEKIVAYPHWIIGKSLPLPFLL